MSSKVTREQAALRGRLGTQEEPVAVAEVTCAGVKTRASVTLDKWDGKQAHMWLRFQSEDSRIHDHMCAQGWHYSGKNRMGYHRQADAQAERMAADLGFPGYAKQASAAAPKASKTSKVQERAKTQASASVPTPKAEPEKSAEVKQPGARDTVRIAGMSDEQLLKVARMCLEELAKRQAK